MKTLKWIGLVIIVGLTVLVVVLLFDRRSEPRTPESTASLPRPLPASDTKAAPATPAPERPAANQPVAVPPIVSPPANVGREPGAATAQAVRVKPGQVLATVNGVAITLKDLLPLPPEKAGTEQVLSAERYGFLLDRAIEREVAFQAARTQGVELSVTQRKRLEDMRTRSGEREPGVFDTVQQNPANTEFEVHDATALLLQAALAEKARVPSPHVTSAQVQAYYQQHQAEYGALPAEPAQRQAAWEKIDQDIRQKLAPQVQAEHQESFQKFLEQLKAAAQIRKASPGS